MKNKTLFSLAACSLTAILFFAIACKKDSDPVTNPGPDKNTSYVKAELFLASEAPQPKSFQVSATSGGQVITPGGVKIIFPAGVFVDQNNNAVSGNVDIKVTEYLSNADMIFSGVTTTSQGLLLNSGGMANITASQGSASLRIKEGSSYDLYFPTSAFDPEMKVFTGKEQAGDNNKINWVQSNGWKTDFDSASNSSTKITFDSIEWVNLDKYYNQGALTKLYVKLPEKYTNTNTCVYLLLPGRSMTRMYGDATAKRFNTGGYSIPEGLNVKVLAVSIIDQVLRYSLKQVTVTTDLEVNVTDDLSVINEAGLKTIIKGL